MNLINCVFVRMRMDWSTVRMCVALCLWVVRELRVLYTLWLLVMGLTMVEPQQRWWWRRFVLFECWLAPKRIIVPFTSSALMSAPSRARAHNRSFCCFLFRSFIRSFVYEYVSTIALILYRIIQKFQVATANKHRQPLHTRTVCVFFIRAFVHSDI